MSRLIPLACAALIGSAAHAQQTPEPAPAPAASSTPAPAPAQAGADGKVVPQVTVSGTRANDVEARRMSTASKLIFGREELDRNGDTSVGEILKRLPGVTMGGPPGRGGGGVRMRGLGNGYTQMLVNGEKPPAGFSLESLAPDQVERIEVMRGPVAEHSTQAIAGTINIVLREGYQQKDVQLKLTDSIEQDRHSPNVSVTVPGKAGQLSWMFNGSMFASRQHDASATHNEDVDQAGVVSKDQQVRSDSTRRSKGVHLTPRFQYKFDNGDTLSFQPFLVHNVSESGGASVLAQAIPVDTLPEFATALGSTKSIMTLGRGFGNWVHRMAGGAKVDVKFGYGLGRTRSDSLRTQYDGVGALRDVITDSERAHGHGGSTGGKYTAPIGKGHLLAAGWDIEAQHRTEDRKSLVVHEQQEFPQVSDDLVADTRRIAGFIQDEWDITPQWSAYLGLRWEGIRTTSSAAGTRADIRNTSSVWSPVLHTVWRIPGYEKDQVRASLTQSYKAPNINDLTAGVSYSRLVSATGPDRTGNPNLKPELAKGIDVAYEHYISKTGILSASVFARNIDQLIRRTTTEYLDEQGKKRWMSTPVNVGHARTSGIELEAKFQLADVMKDAPNIDLRANYSRFWSSVDGVPGPDNRLDGQARQTANFGMDYRMKGVPLTLGGGYNWTPAIQVRQSETEFASTGVKRQFDMYGLWKFSPATQLRIGANNLQGSDYLSGRTVVTDGLSQMASTAARTYTTWSIKLEMKI